MTNDDRQFVETIASRLRQEGKTLCGDWLYQLSQVLPLGPNDILPTKELLDHIPALLAAIADDLAAPETGGVKANSIVLEKARELGSLRYSQDGSVHQILREYDILATLLGEFVHRETERSSLRPSPAVCFSIIARLDRAIRILMQVTVDTFIAHYVETIELHRQRLTDFNRVVSHELRNPMNTLQVASELLITLDSPDAEHQKRLATMVQAAVKQMRQLLEGVEKLSSGSRGAVLPQNASASVQQVDIGATARDAANQLQGMAEPRQVETRVGEDLPSLVIDVPKLEMIFLNLLGNSIKYSDPSKDTRYVEIVADDTTPDKNFVTILVRDNGIGVPARALGRIFERFYRANNQLDRDQEVEGSGLGLAIVRECIDDLGGSIEVESTEGQGTLFRLRLPRRPPS